VQMRALLGCVAVFTVATGLSEALVQTERSGSDGVYTNDQAERGHVLYEEQCVSCHGEMRAIVPEMAALLADHTFRGKWRGRSLGELFELIRLTMPQDKPGTLSSGEAVALVAYILSGNRMPAANTELPDDVTTLETILFERDP